MREPVSVPYCALASAVTPKYGVNLYVSAPSHPLMFAFDGKPSTRWNEYPANASNFLVCACAANGVNRANIRMNAILFIASSSKKWRARIAVRWARLRWHATMTPEESIAEMFSCEQPSVNVHTLPLAAVRLSGVSGTASVLLSSLRAPHLRLRSRWRPVRDEKSSATRDTQ